MSTRRKERQGKERLRFISFEDSFGIACYEIFFFIYVQKLRNSFAVNIESNIFYLRNLFLYAMMEA